MASTREQRAPAHSTVASCSATECAHNENMECHAGEIQVETTGRGAICGTYNPRKPKARP